MLTERNKINILIKALWLEKSMGLCRNREGMSDYYYLITIYGERILGHKEKAAKAVFKLLPMFVYSRQLDIDTLKLLVKGYLHEKKFIAYEAEFNELIDTNFIHTGWN